jgi:hypothetical protein
MFIFTLLNIVIHHTGSTGAVPLGMYFSIVAVWFLVSIPLTFAGGYLATKAEILNYPVSAVRGLLAGGGGCQRRLLLLQPSRWHQRPGPSPRGP